MTSYTDPDRIPYPDDMQEPADSPAALQSLANAVQTALTSIRASVQAIAVRTISAGYGLTGGGSLEASRTLAVDTATIATRGYADGKVTNALGGNTTIAPSQAAVGSGLAAKSDTSHGHTYQPSSVGIVAGSVNLGTIGPGAEASTVIAKEAGQRVIVSVNHPSTYILGTGEEINAGQARLEARNTTSGTTHTNVILNYVLVRQA